MERNYIPLLDMDVIIHPFPKLDAGVAKIWGSFY